MRLLATFALGAAAAAGVRDDALLVRAQNASGGAERFGTIRSVEIRAVTDSTGSKSSGGAIIRAILPDHLFLAEIVPGINERIRLAEVGVAGTRTKLGDYVADFVRGSEGDRRIRDEIGRILAAHLLYVSSECKLSRQGSPQAPRLLVDEPCAPLRFRFDATQRPARLEYWTRRLQAPNESKSVVLSSNYNVNTITLSDFRTVQNVTLPFKAVTERQSTSFAFQVSVIRLNPVLKPRELDISSDLSEARKWLTSAVRLKR